MKCTLLALATLVAFSNLVLTPLMQAQQRDKDSPPAAQLQDGSSAPPPQANDAPMPASGKETTEEAKTFSGRIVEEEGGIVLKDPITKVTHKLSDPAKAKPFLDKQVKIIGKIDRNTNTIMVQSIMPIS